MVGCSDCGMPWAHSEASVLTRANGRDYGEADPYIVRTPRPTEATLQTRGCADSTDARSESPEYHPIWRDSSWRRGGVRSRWPDRGRSAQRWAVQGAVGTRRDKDLGPAELGRVADRGGGEQPSRHTQPGGDQQRGGEAMVEPHWVQVGRAADAGCHRQHRDGDQPGDPGDVVVDR